MNLKINLPDSNKDMPYEFSLVSDNDAEILNEKMNEYNAKQISLTSQNEDVELIKNYVFKHCGSIVAGIRACFYFKKCLAINLLFVDENHRNKGLGSLLLNKVEEEAKETGVELIHLDTFDFQAKEFYLKHGYEVFGTLENCPHDHERYYMRKNLKNAKDKKTREVTRIGVYGIAMEEGQILLVCQKRGPYAGKFDFPGGGIEFRESMEQALRREFLEEVAMEFDSMNLIDNLSTTIQVMQTTSNSSYTFHHIGMIYRLEGCRLINKTQVGDLQHSWINLKSLSEEECSPLLWKYRMKLKKL